MKVQKNRKTVMSKARVLCGVLLVALSAELTAQAQSTPVTLDPVQLAEREAVERQAAVLQVRNYLERAKKAQASGDKQEALRLYSDAYKTLSQVGGQNNPEVTDAYREVAAGITEACIYAAENALKKQDCELALERLDYALRVDPTNLKVQRLKEKALQQKQLSKNRVTSKEVREYGEDLQKRNEEVAQLVHDSKMLYEMGAYQKAREKLSAALEIDPANRTARYYQKLLEEKTAADIMRQRSMVADSAVVDVARTWAMTTNAQSLPIPNIMATTNLIHTSIGRQRILNKLDRITVGQVKFDGIPLKEVATWLKEESIKNDPDRQGINFLCNNTIDKPVRGLESMYMNVNEIDPMTGMPRMGMGAAMGNGMGGGMGNGGMGGNAMGQQANAFSAMYMDMGDINEFVVHIDPPLERVRLSDALDAITKTSDRPLKYSVEDYAVVFTQRLPENAQLFHRIFKVDPNTFWQGLTAVSAEEVGAEGSNSSGGSSSGESVGGYIARVYTASGSGSSNIGQSNGNSNTGGAGLPYVTYEADSGVVQERVRRFFTSVTGVNFMSGIYSSESMSLNQNQGGGGMGMGGMGGGMGGTMGNMVGSAGTGTATPGHSLVFNDRSGVLFVRSTTEVLDVIEQVIQTLNVPPPQVSIEVKFVEVDQEDQKALGFDWYLGNFTIGGGQIGGQGGTAPSYNGTPSESNPLGTFPYPGQASSATDQQVTSGLTSNSGIPALATITGILTDPQFRVVIRALEARTGTEVLSCPKLTTVSGRQAQVQVAVLRNIATGADVSSSSSTSASVGSGTVVSEPIGMIEPESANVSTGPTLDVIPYVSADGYSIQMTLIPSIVNFLGYGNPDIPEAAEFESTLRAQAGDADAPLALPRFQVRQVATSVIVWDGQTVMIGGLISEDVARKRQKVPVLGDIPLLGRLFRSEVNNSAKKNLIIFVTPQMIDPAGNPIHDLLDQENLPYNPNSIPVQSTRDVRVAGSRTVGM